MGGFANHEARWLRNMNDIKEKHDSNDKNRIHNSSDHHNCNHNHSRNRNRVRNKHNTNRFTWPPLDIGADTDADDDSTFPRQPVRR